MGTLKVDATHLKAYLADRKKRDPQNRISVTTVVMRAVGLALRATPGLNGQILLGRYVQSPSVDVSCLVRMEREEGGKKVPDLGFFKIKNADQCSPSDIQEQIRTKADKLRCNKDKVRYPLPVPCRTPTEEGVASRIYGADRQCRSSLFSFSTCVVVGCVCFARTTRPRSPC